VIDCCLVVALCGDAAQLFRASGPSSSRTFSFQNFELGAIAQLHLLPGHVSTLLLLILYTSS
jgi:hypothetical protein